MAYGVVMVNEISPGTVIVPKSGSVTERIKFTPISDFPPEGGEFTTMEIIEFGKLPSEDNVVKVIGFDVI